MQRILLLLVGPLLCASPVFAQSGPFKLAAEVPSVSQVFGLLFGSDGLKLDSSADLGDGQAHNAHFNSSFQADFSQFGTAIARNLVSVPLPSPASSVVYEYNAEGNLVRSKKSFGPVLAERTETVGKGRASVGFAFQRFDMSTFEGLTLGALPSVFQHDDPQPTGGTADVVSTVNAIDASVDQFTTFVTYGITDRIDLSLAIPLVATSITVRSEATVLRLGSTNPAVHFFRQMDGSIGDQRIFTSSGQSSGIGDVTVRVKSLLARWGSSGGLGLGVDLRIPTGDENEVLGAGAAGVKPFAIWSATYGVLSPHVNLGYLWNGSSLLAGNIEAGTSGDLPDLVTFAGGADLRVSGRVTAVFDALADYVIDGPRVVPATFARSGVSLPNTAFTTGSFTEWNGAAGMKVLLARDLLLNANVLFRMNTAGLRSRATFLIGLGYTM
jgi:hypothetical protein